MTDSVEIDEGILKSGKLEVTQNIHLKYGLNKDNLSFDLTGAIILKYECLQKESCWELKLLEAQAIKKYYLIFVLNVVHVLKLP